MTTFLKSVDSAKMIVNGKVIEDAMVDTSYDSIQQKLTIDIYNKGKRDHVEALGNKNIMKILSKPANAMSLEKRLTKDFGIHKRKSMKGKTYKRKTYNRKSMKRKKY